jgi:nucleoside-diphosphate-sugar epimerase
VYLVREGCPFPAREQDYAGPVIPEPDDPDLRAGWRYGVDKRAAEDALIAAWRETGFPSTRLRLPMVNGEGDYYRRIEGYLWRIRDGGPILLPGGGGRRCRHVYGAEVARAVEALLGNPATFGEAYNLSQDEEPTLSDLLGFLAGELGAPFRTLAVEPEALRAAGLNPRDVSPFSGPWMSRLDPARSINELGFRHEPAESYLARIAAWFRAGAGDRPPPGYEHRAAELALAQALR